MAVRTYDVYRRDTLTVTVDVVGDWTAWTWKAQLRRRRDDDSELLAAFTAGTPTFADGRTECVLTIPAVTMQAIDDQIPLGFYDVRVSLAGVEQTLAAGQLNLGENVTP